jgi:hypothetical protein
MNSNELPYESTCLALPGKTNVARFNVPEPCLHLITTQPAATAFISLANCRVLQKLKVRLDACRTDIHRLFRRACRTSQDTNSNDICKGGILCRCYLTLLPEQSLSHFIGIKLADAPQHTSSGALARFLIS